VTDDELLARLQAADPARRAPAPSYDWIDDLTEATMTRTADTPRRRIWLVAAAAAAVVAALGVGVAALDDGDPAPRATQPADAPVPALELTAPPGPEARCMIVTAQTLSRMPTAFEATVTSVDGRRATLSVDRWYAGTAAERRATTVRLTSATQSMTDLIGAVRFEGGERYLIAAHDGEMAACGFSAPWSQGLADTYAAAYGQ